MRGIQIVGAQRAQLFAAQRRIVSQRQHQPITDRLQTERLEQPQPLRLSRDPRQLDHPRDQRPGLATAEAPARRVTATADRIGLAHTLLDQEVVKQPYRDHCCNVAFARPEPESNTTTFDPRRLGRVRNSLTNKAIWALVAETGSMPSRSHTNRYSARPRAYASIVRGARPRSTQICSHSRARS